MTTEAFDRAAHGVMTISELAVAFERIVGEAPEKRNKLWMLKRMEQATSAREAARRAAEGASSAEAAHESEVAPEAETREATAPAQQSAPPIEAARDEGGAPGEEASEIAAAAAGGAPVAVARSAEPTAPDAREPASEEGETRGVEPDREGEASVSTPRDAQAGVGDTVATPKRRYIPSRFKGMSVEQIRAVFAETVGRPTKSSDKPYLCWRITGAERLRNGPSAAPRRSRRLAADGTSRGEAKAVTLREYPDTLEAVEEVCARHGLRNRLDFFRRAARHYLEHLGEGAAAVFFAEMVPTERATNAQSPRS